MKLNYQKLVLNLDFSNFVMLKHQARFNPDSIELIELTIPN